MNLETIQIHLNAADANSYNNNSTSDCNFTLPVIELPNQHQILLSVQSAVIPYTFYNIDYTNNLLVYSTFNSDGSPNIVNRYFYMHIGNYNAIQLANYLSTNSLFPNFSVSYDIIRNVFIIVNSVENFTFDHVNSTCLELLGFSSKQALLYTTSYLKTLISTQCVNLLSKQCICIASNLQTGNINHSNLAEGNILCSVPVQSNPYSLITYTNLSNFKTNLYSNVISNVNIKITDQNNNLLNLNGCFFSLTLQIDVVKFVE